MPVHFLRLLALVAGFVFAILAVAGPLLAADDDKEDREQLCPLVSPELARRAAEVVKGQGRCEVVCSGCGCKGGPGYRGLRGCVGWANLISVCGPPPHNGCMRECQIVEPGCVGRSWLKALAAGLGLAVSFVPADPGAFEKPPRPRRVERPLEAQGMQAQ